MKKQLWLKKIEHSKTWTPTVIFFANPLVINLIGSKHKVSLLTIEMHLAETHYLLRETSILAACSSSNWGVLLLDVGIWPKLLLGVTGECIRVELSGRLETNPCPGEPPWGSEPGWGLEVERPRGDAIWWPSGVVFVLLLRCDKCREQNPFRWDSFMQSPFEQSFLHCLPVI